MTRTKSDTKSVNAMAILENLDTTAIARVQDTAMITKVSDTASTGVSDTINIEVPGVVPRTIEMTIIEIPETARTKSADHPRNR
jgi:hypothetical protein